MALTQTQIDKTIRRLVELADELNVPMNHSSANLRQAVADVDAWATANATSYNNTLAQPFRGAASVAEKNVLLAYVCLARAGLL